MLQGSTSLPEAATEKTSPRKKPYKVFLWG